MQANLEATALSIALGNTMVDNPKHALGCAKLHPAKCVTWNHWGSGGNWDFCWVYIHAEGEEAPRFGKHYILASEVWVGDWQVKSG
jgi:hypothetical protein